MNHVGRPDCIKFDMINTPGSIIVECCCIRLSALLDIDEPEEIEQTITFLEIGKIMECYACEFMEECPCKRHRDLNPNTYPCPMVMTMD